MSKYSDFLPAGADNDLVANLTNDGDYDGLTTTLHISGNGLLGTPLTWVNGGEGTDSLHGARASDDEYTELPCVALGIGVGGEGENTVLLRGFVRRDSWNWTVGAKLYVGNLAGYLVDSPGEIEQQIGVAITEDIIYFDPKSRVIPFSGGE